MSRKWTIEEAKAYIMKVLKGKQQIGLTYCSAVDFLVNHTNARIDKRTLSFKEEDENVSDTIG